MEEPEVEVEITDYYSLWNNYLKIHKKDVAEAALTGYLIIRHEDLPTKLFDQSYNDPDSALEYIREVCKK